MSKRATHLREFMDDPECNLQRLHRTYEHLRWINRWMTRWRTIYLTVIRPQLTNRRTYRLLDVGCGGGDLPFQLWRWAQADGIRMSITAIDTDVRAVNYVQAHSWPSDLRFLHASTSDLRHQGERFDFVVSNHLLHHLTDEEVRQLHEDVDALCSCLAVFNDLARNPVKAATWYFIARLPFWGSYVAADGRMSILRAYTRAELARLLAPNWQVHRWKPNRLVAIYRK